MRGDDEVVKLCRSLYGLRQASQQWHHHLLRGMRGLGFEHCEADASVMHLVEEGAVSILVVCAILSWGVY